MKSLSALLLPAVLGLIAGMTYGVISHTMDLPESLGEQVMQPLESSNSVFSDF